MVRSIGITAVTLTASLVAWPAAPAAAQASERVLIIYGDDACPSSNGEEIVVCVRRDENERYRIPPELRELRDLGANQSWLARAQAVEYVGRSGTMSCSPVGAGGFTGCTEELLRQAREDSGSAVFRF